MASRPALAYPLGLSPWDLKRLPAQSPDAVLRLVTVALGFLCSVERQFKKTREENEKILGSLFSSPHLRSLLRPDCKARVNTQVYDSKRYKPCMVL